MKALHQMNRLEALDYFLGRAEKIAADYQQLFLDLSHCEERWPGQFARDKAQVHSEWQVMELNVKRLRKQRDQELSR